MSDTYIGRFAPSPTGPLHFGSLACAVTSYLDAKYHNGQWLIRIEDLDPPREVDGATTAILQSLEKHALHSDKDILYQHSRLAAYQDALDTLINKQWAYPCSCTRQQLKAMNGVYNGYCRDRTLSDKQPHAYRLKVSEHLPSKTDRVYVDLFQGQQTQNVSTSIGDYIIRRKDQLFAYQLAVVVDDIYQGVNHIIRGYDLIDSAPRQHYLFELLDYPVPVMGHIPVVANAQGQKLSKQNLSPPLNDDLASHNLFKVFQFLQLNPPAEIRNEPPREQLSWATRHWQRSKVPQKKAIPEASIGK